MHRKMPIILKVCSDIIKNNEYNFKQKDLLLYDWMK